jgi:hypothetical protein
MITDFITKSLQGTTSRKFRDIIMGIETSISGNNICNKKKLSKVADNKKSKSPKAMKLAGTGNSLAHY